MNLHLGLTHCSFPKIWRYNIVMIMSFFTVISMFQEHCFSFIYCSLVVIASFNLLLSLSLPRTAEHVGKLHGFLQSQKLTHNSSSYNGFNPENICFWSWTHRTDLVYFTVCQFQGHWNKERYFNVASVIGPRPDSIDVWWDFFVGLFLF